MRPSNDEKKKVVTSLVCSLCKTSGVALVCPSVCHVLVSVSVLMNAADCQVLDINAQHRGDSGLAV